MCLSCKLNQVKLNKHRTLEKNQVLGKKTKLADNDCNIVVAANKIRKNSFWSSWAFQNHPEIFSDFSAFTMHQSFATMAPMGPGTAGA